MLRTGGQATMAQFVNIGSVLLQVSLLDSKCFVLQVLCDQRGVTIAAWCISDGFGDLTAVCQCGDQRGVTIAIIDFCLCNDVCNL